MTAAKLYAQALFELLPKEATVARVDMLSKQLTVVLAKRGHTRLLPAIYREFSKLAERIQSGAILTVAREDDAKSLQQMIAKASEEIGADTKHLRTVIDDDLIGGYTLRYGSKLRDASWRTQLISLYQRLKTLD